jgi:heme-degrading monooxygenase HmoA
MRPTTSCAHATPCWSAPTSEAAVYVIVWTYRVAHGSGAAFEALYDADGGWARLFRRSPAYVGTELLRDTADASRYLTIDRWHTRAAYEAFLRDARDDYAALDRQGDALTREEARLVAFES